MGRSWRGRRQRVHNRRWDALAALDPYEFEQVVADYYRGEGYKVEHCGGRGRFDRGIDLKMHREGEYVIVQCKRENAYQLPHNVGHELLGVLLTEKADRAIVVNTGEFKPYAWESARKEPRLELIDGTRLREMLPGYARPVTEPEPVDDDGGDVLSARPPTDIQPTARQPMVVHPAKKSFANPKTSWTPALDTSGRKRPSGRRGQRSDGACVIMAFAVLAAMVVWQCSRAPLDTSTSSDRRAPSLAPTPVVHSSGQTVSHPGRDTRSPAKAVPKAPAHSNAGSPASRSPEESRRRANEAMRVLEATTPEFEPLP